LDERLETKKTNLQTQKEIKHFAGRADRGKKEDTVPRVPEGKKSPRGNGWGKKKKKPREKEDYVKTIEEGTVKDPLGDMAEGTQKKMRAERDDATQTEKTGKKALHLQRMNKKLGKNPLYHQLDEAPTEKRTVPKNPQKRKV